MADPKSQTRHAQTGRAEAALAALDDAEKARLTAGAATFATAGLEAIALQPVNMADGPMGVASTRVDERDVSALTPCGLALAASWDLDLVAEVGALVGDEARSKGVQVMLAPNLGTPRSPLAGRAFETFSEDPFLTGEIGAAWITGLQSRGVGACAKHVVGNDSETNRDQMNSVIDPRALREVYLAPFERAAAAGAWGMLMAYNRVNGVHCVEHSELIQDIVKNEWRFDGFVVSDWFGTFSTTASANAGLDLEMPGPARVFGASFGQAVADGAIAQARLDDAALRMLRLAERAGRLGEAPSPPPPGARAQAEVLRDAAAAGFVLLQNRGGSLPLDPARGRRVAVIGPNAAAPCYQGGTFAKIGLRPTASPPLAAIGEAFVGRFEVSHAVGVRPEFRLPPLEAHPIRDLGDGARGMTVEYFAGHDLSGPPLAAETRNTNSLTWFGALPGAGALDKPVAVRARGLLTAEIAGPHTLFVGGTGSVRLAVDGHELFRREVQIEPKDVMGRLKSGVADAVAIELAAGQTVEVAVELKAMPARAQGLWWGHEAPVASEALLAEAEAAARAADHVLLMLGETADAGVESVDRCDTRLSDDQLELIRRVAAANPNTVVVLNAAHPVDMPWAEAVAAVLVAWYPGEEFGAALADVLLGVREPGGRLPVTFAREEADYSAFGLTPDAGGDLPFSEGVRVGYRSFAARGVAPRFGLGHGLGYGEVAYEDVRVEATASEVRVRAVACNTAGRPTKSVFQVYVRAQTEAPAFPKLAGFATDQLAAGERREIAVRLPGRAFARWDVEARGWRAIPGLHEILAGRSLTAAAPCGEVDGTGLDPLSFAG